VGVVDVFEIEDPDHAGISQPKAWIGV